MPTYDYSCDKCKTTQEIVHSINDNPTFKCKKCKKKLRREIGVGAFVTTNMNGTLEDMRERNHTSKVKDLDRAVKKRKRILGSTEVGNPVDKPDPKHIIRRGKHIAGQEQEIDKQELTKALAKDNFAVDIARRVVEKKNV